MSKRAMLTSVLAAFLMSGCALIVTETSSEQSETNESPSLSFTVTPDPADVGEIVVLRAGETTDPDGDALRYRFFVRGPAGNVVHRREGSSATTDFQPERSGTYDVRVRVLDEHGAASRTSVDLEVTNRPPRMEASWSLYSDGDQAAFGSGTEGIKASGNLDKLVAQLERVRDPDGHDTTVHWVLDVSPPEYSGGCTACDGMDFTLEMTEPGVYEGRAVVRDEYGAAATFPFSIQKTR